MGKSASMTLMPVCSGRVTGSRSKMGVAGLDRKSTRLNSSHVRISYAVFCLKKKNRSPDIAIEQKRTRREAGFLCLKENPPFVGLLSKALDPGFNASRCHGITHRQMSAGKRA